MVVCQSARRAVAVVPFYGKVAQVHLASVSVERASRLYQQVGWLEDISVVAHMVEAVAYGIAADRHLAQYEVAARHDVYHRTCLWVE